MCDPPPHPPSSNWRIPSLGIKCNGGKSCLGDNSWCLRDTFPRYHTQILWRGPQFKHMNQDHWMRVACLNSIKYLRPQQQVGVLDLRGLIQVLRCHWEDSSAQGAGAGARAVGFRMMLGDGLIASVPHIRHHGKLTDGC